MEHFSYKCGKHYLSFGIKQNRIRLLSISKRAPNFDERLFDSGRFVEVQMSGFDQNGHHGIKNLSTYFGSNSVFVGKEIKQNEAKQELIISTKTDEILVKTHLISYKGVDGLSIFNEVENIGKETYTLEFVSSAFITNIFDACSGKDSKDVFFHSATNSWHVEAQWRRHSFLDLGMFNGNDDISVKRLALNNTGSWSSKEYLPMCVLEHKNKFILAQVENNGSWHIEVGDMINRYYLSASGPTFFDNQWFKKIKPGEVFTGVTASLCFGDSFESVIQEITKLRRAVRRKFVDNETLPVIFNDYMHALWDVQTEETIKPLVDIAKEVGCEEFCIDAGWFAEKAPWWNLLGDWEAYENNFPSGGFKGMIDYIHSKGMKAGIWYEIEAVGEESKLFKNHDKSWFFNVNGKLTFHHSRHQLNFANKDVYDWAKGIIEYGVKTYGLDYIKMDYNTDSGPGNDYNTDSLGDGLLIHARAYISWVNEIEDEFPNLTIENCASGGCRMDYETLKYFPIQSTSDQIDYKKYPYLSSAVLTACPPEQAAVWSYPLDSRVKPEDVSDEAVAMNMCNAMLGRIHLASYINKLTPRQIDLIKEGVDFFKATRDWKKNSLPIYPNGISYFFDKNVVGGIMDDNNLMLGVWNTSDKKQVITVDLKKYKIKSLSVGYPTSLNTKYSFKNGILKVEMKEPYSGRVFIAKR